MTDNLDDILSEIQRNRENWNTEPENEADKAQEERRSKVASFKLSMDLDDQFGEYTPPEPPKEDLSHTRAIDPIQPPAVQEPKAEEPVAPVAHVAIDEPQPQASAPVEDQPLEQAKPRKRRRKKTDPRAREVWGCAGGIFYVLLTIGASLVLACLIIMAGLDLTGLNKSPIEVKVALEEGATVDEIAAELKDNGLIDYEWVFTLYTKVRGAEADFKPGVYTLAPNMGCGNIVDILRNGVPRTVVRVTVPEGFTVDAIAALMEDNAVCSKKEFYSAVLSGDYSDYSFIAEIPAEEGAYEGRGYALEGYLFPDTYDFYTGSSGEAVVRKLLDNFNTRVDTTYKTKIAAAGMTINDVVTLASIVQAEASDGEWGNVSRVFTNRLNNKAEFPRLQSDATVNYYKNLDLSVEGLTISQDAYDTAVREGLTPGAVCNPGLRAIDAVLAPSDNEDVVKCYYFATDYSTGITYYSATHAQHEAVCKKYGIGMYAPKDSNE